MLLSIRDSTTCIQGAWWTRTQPCEEPELTKVIANWLWKTWSYKPAEGNSEISVQNQNGRIHMPKTRPQSRADLHKHCMRTMSTKWTLTACLCDVRLSVSTSFIMEYNFVVVAEHSWRELISAKTLECSLATQHDTVAPPTEAVAMRWPCHSITRHCDRLKTRLEPSHRQGIWRAEVLPWMRDRTVWRSQQK